MHAFEPLQTAVLLAVIGLMLALSVVSSRFTRLGVPIVLIFLGLGMLAGSEGVGGIAFENYHLAFRLGTIALVLILFDGGLNTPGSLLRSVAGPSITLATLGVLGTAGLVGLGARWAGFSWSEALLLGAIVSSTDAAAVFSVLRGSQLAIRRRVAATLEAESGLNDPMAVVLTVALTEAALHGGRLGFGSIALAALQLVIGAALGLGFGLGGRWVLARVRPAAGGLYVVLTLALAFLAFGVPTLLFGSGFLSVYVAGVILGNGPLPNRTGVLRVHDALAWLSQIVMFLTLGLLVFPSKVAPVVVPGLLIALPLILVGRPLVTTLCLLPFRYPWREHLYIGWMGLRGAVPIVLGTYPVLAGVPGGERIFNIVFVIVVASVLLQGSTARGLTRRLGLAATFSPPPPAVVELSSTRPLRGELLSFFIGADAAASGATLAEIPFPPDSAAVLIIRGENLIAPRGEVAVQPGDHVYVFCLPEDRPFIKLLFGQVESE
jgi:cell volume regulation protein A